jgi:hypothetical protein
VVICVVLLFSAQWREVRDVAIGTAAGLLCYVALRLFRKTSTRSAGAAAP